ncbi:hypothetical protein VHUM_03132 [Vanrija humicola]|uniref:Glutathione S-transferase n=1 Tax=Vanrija humicola TaxID=5417 RepID=A0A7D8V3Z0_VANHU|nr:hypothetical protein VHUM_03132 [Vanrija humicola]
MAVPLGTVDIPPPAPPALGPSQAGEVAGQGAPKIHLYTGPTPNGYKVSIHLEELRAAYPELAKGALSYDVSAIDISTNAQKHPSFLKINPNGRIPAIVDDNFDGHNVFETASILLWLSENYDPEHKFTFADPKLRSKALSWIFFAHGGVGPMQGQAHVFFRYAPVKVPFGIKRYIQETERLYSVLEDGLNAGKGEWLVGDKFSIADINVYPWVRSSFWAGIDIRKFPKLDAWVTRIGERDAVKKGLEVPKSSRGAVTQEEKEKAYADAAEWIAKADAELAALKK